LYVLERWLHRASISPYHDQFVLKGGLLLAALDARRTTRDGDLLAQMDNDEAQVVKRVQEIASIEEDDGVQFNVNMAQATAIREEDQYAGVRVTMPASIGKALAKVALDINFGDPVTPGAVRIPYPGLLGARPVRQEAASPSRSATSGYTDMGGGAARAATTIRPRG
jgi:hypothetical protein